MVFIEYLNGLSSSSFYPPSSISSVQLFSTRVETTVSPTFLIRFSSPPPPNNPPSPFTPPFLSYLFFPSKNIPEERQLLSRRLRRERNCNDITHDAVHYSRPCELWTWSARDSISPSWPIYRFASFRKTRETRETKIIRSRWNWLSGSDTTRDILSFRGVGRGATRLCFISAVRIA